MAMPASPRDGNLSQRLAQLTEPALVFKPMAQAARQLGLPSSGPASLLRRGNRIVVEVRFDSGAAAAVGALRAAGAEIIQVTPQFQTVTVAAKPEELRAIGALGRVAAVTQVLTPMARGVVCPGGSATTEGDQQMNASGARSSLGVDGTGVTVGILSDSFDRSTTAATHAATDVSTGDLPGPGNPCGSPNPVKALDDSNVGGEDEGRAMIQIVHDLAPGASIDFASASAGILPFAANIRALANAGANVIADDVGYFEEPFFQDGPVAQAANEVTAKGDVYLSADGNDNRIDEGTGRNITSWEAPQYRDSGTCLPAIVTLSEEEEEEERNKGIQTPEGLHPTHCMDFNPDPTKSDTGFGILVEEGGSINIDLQWAEPWFGVHTDLDAFLVGTVGGTDQVLQVAGSPVAATEDNIGTSKKPNELLHWNNNTGEEQAVALVINRPTGTGPGPRLKFVFPSANGLRRIEYEKSELGDVVGPAIYGQPAAASSIGVGAVPYNDSSAPEDHSNRGPVKHFFGPVVGGTPAAPTAEQDIPKPDVSATDGGATTFFSQKEADGTWRFFGTSAAAPHAAAVIALMRQANPTASPAQLKAALAKAARPIGSFGPTEVGAGLIEALGAVKAVELPPAVTITKAPPALSNNPRPEFQFTANRSVSFRCQVGSGAAVPCASPFTVPASLGDGPNSFTVTGVAGSGREGSGRVTFAVDTKAPQTSILKHPRRFLFTHRGRFRFGADENGASFECSVDRGPFRPCPPNLSRSFRSGRHVIKVRAHDPAGNLDSTPAVFHFSVL
jgi:hypothetical protein